MSEQPTRVAVADGAAAVYKTTQHEYQVDRDLNARQRRAISRESLPENMAHEWKVAFRGVLPGDFHFVLNAWMQSYRHAQRSVKNEAYYTGQQNLIAEIAKRRTCIIACDADTPDFIFGFICGQLFEDGTTLVDYVYVKKFYRERGVARGLAASLGVNIPKGVTVTHITPSIIDFVKAHRLDYNPYYNMLGYSDV